MLVHDFCDACNERGEDDEMSVSERLVFELEWERKFLDVLKAETRAVLGRDLVYP